MKLSNSIVVLAVASILPQVASALPANDAAIGDPGEQCLGMWVDAPKGQPANAEFPIRLTVQGGAVFSSYEDPEIFVSIDGAYEPAAFELTVDSDNPSRSRIARLTKPRAGTYIVTWRDGDCVGMTSPVDATSTVVGSFDVSAEAELPTALGDFDSVESNPHGGTNPGWSATFHVDLDASAQPWQHVMEYGLEIGDILVEDFALGGAYQNKVSIHHWHVCEGNELPPGFHNAMVVGRYGDHEVRTEPVQVEIICMEPESRGCSVGAAGSGSWLGLLVVLGFVGRRRRSSTHPIVAKRSS